MVVGDAVGRAGHQGFLSRNGANRSSISIRQPGEDRNLRMGHSVRHEYLLSFRVIGRRIGVADVGGPGIERGAPNHPQGSGISRRRRPVHRGGMVAEVRYPQFIMFPVIENAGRALDPAPGTLNDPFWRHIAAGGHVKNQNGITRIVGDKNLPASRVNRESGRPV